ncbi:hypothetical protein [Caballeronia fortuita]|uniref:hypothetical protein n=1 Tax=Caballeronia fortuita TaxID=1777138 RepID=UPI0012FDF7C0|nr:hypothetical protein [Caballeronia fortuita]
MHGRFEAPAEWEFVEGLGDATFFAAARNRYLSRASMRQRIAVSRTGPPDKASTETIDSTSKAALEAVNHLCNIFGARLVSTATRLSGA